MVWFRSSRDRVVYTERNCTKHVAASKLYKNKLVLLSGAIFYVSTSPRLPSQNFKHKLTPSRKALFFKTKVSPILKLLNKASNLYILSDSETSKNRYIQRM